MIYLGDHIYIYSYSDCYLPGTFVHNLKVDVFSDEISCTIELIQFQISYGYIGYVIVSY